MSPKQRDPTTSQFARTPTPQSELKTSPATEQKPGVITESSSASEGGSSNHNPMKAAWLRIIELKQQLDLARMSASNPQQMGIQLIHNKVAEFKQELAFKSLTIIFKLEESLNYDVWQDEALIQTLAIKAKDILQNFKMTCSESTMNSEDR